MSDLKEQNRSASQVSQTAGAVNSADYQQRRGVFGDIVDEALCTYAAWLTDSADNDASRCLHTIMDRMRERRDLYTTGHLPDVGSMVAQPSESGGTKAGKKPTHEEVCAWGMSDDPAATLLRVTPSPTPSAIGRREPGSGAEREAYMRPLVDTGQRVVAWFSCGDTSAVATKLALAKWGDRVVIARIVLKGEHADNDRFAADCAAWFGQPILNLSSKRYEDHWGVIAGERYINGPHGAKCSALLKRKVREDFQRLDDIQVFGFDEDEERAQNRARDFRQHHPEIMVATPLLDEHLGKSDCHALIQRAGIEIPAMYRLGYGNNNCIGCVKGGMGYWNKIRRDFPETFTRMAVQERALGRSCIKTKVDGQVFLDELDPGRGRYEDEPAISCGITCFIAESKMGDAA